MTREEYWAGQFVQAIMQNNTLRKAVATQVALRKQKNPSLDITEAEATVKYAKQYVLALIDEFPSTP